MTGVAAEKAWIQLCGPESSPRPPAPDRREYLRTDGSRRWLELSNEPDPGCEHLALPVPVSEVRWFGLIPESTARRLPRGVILQGTDGRQRIRVSEVVATEPTTFNRTPLPLAIPLFSQLNPRTFGLEERAEGVLTEDRLQLSCAPGRQPAGIVLKNDGARLPEAIESSLVLGYQADSEFGVGYADGQTYSLDDPYRLGELAGLPSDSINLSAAPFPLPASDLGGKSGSATIAFTLMCPKAGGSLSLSTLQLSAEPVVEVPPRSIWIWQPSEWLEHPELLLEELATLSTPVVYVSVPIEHDQVTHAESLGRFIAAAHARGIKVWAVEGDPHAVLPDGQAVFAERARALSRFNADQPSAQRLDGVQYDIEPYLLPDFSLHTDDWLVAYVQTIATLNTVLDVPLEIAVPFWWSSLELHEGSLLDALAPHIQSLNVMNYRTDPEQLQLFAEPFLAWGVEHDVGVRIALEAGPIPDEQRWHFKMSGEAKIGSRLWHLSINGEQLLVLLREPVVVAEGTGYRYVRQSHLDGSRLTFRGDRVRMNRIMAKLESLWRAWPSFTGLALHEYRLHGE